MSKPPPPSSSILSQIAKDVLGFDTLEARRGASDFREVAVWQVRAALLRAFETGQYSQPPAEPPPLLESGPTRFDVTIVEVLVHRAVVEASSLHQANELAREMWDEDGAEAFSTETLGRAP